MALTKMGYNVSAVTGKDSKSDYLKSLGAKNIINRAEFDKDPRPIDKGLWDGVVDTVGGKILANAIAQTKSNGIIAICGNANSNELNTNLLPFMLRGIKVWGMDSANCSIKRRGFIWGEATNLIDFDLGTKITGAGFPVYVERGARLQRALISYFLDKNINAGYIEYLPPHLVNYNSAYGTGQLPKFEDDLYKIASEGLYLIPTAEVPITNLFRDVIIKEFPVKCTSYTPCFRQEAGSYGKDVRGLNRLHQFDKVEIVQVQHPDKSYETLDMMVEHVASIIDELELPYRVLKLCGGDLSFASSLTFDFEVFSAGQKKWLEVSSVSNFESYQANRLKLRYKDNNGKMNLCHTLNGSALALPRIYAALLENNQTSQGIKIPKVLQKYTGFDTLL